MQPVQLTFLSIPLEAWLTIAAIIIGPIAALLIQKYFERSQAETDRKIGILRQLMANRATRLAPSFVQSLNAIEMEFYGKTEVLEAWRILNEHLYTPHDAVGDPQMMRWTERTTDPLSELLHQMAKSLGYHFDKVTLKRNVYFPAGWNTLEVEQMKIRQAAIKVLEGQTPIKIKEVDD
jgi:hypothetical protein